MFRTRLESGFPGRVEPRQVPIYTGVFLRRPSRKRSEHVTFHGHGSGVGQGDQRPRCRPFTAHLRGRRDPGALTRRTSNLQAAGFSSAIVAHADSLLDGYIYGFAPTKISLPFETPEDIEDVTQRMMEPYLSTEYPHLARFVNEHIMRPGYEFAEEFEYGLDLILDALERKVAAAGGGG